MLKSPRVFGTFLCGNQNFERWVVLSFLCNMLTTNVS